MNISTAIRLGLKRSSLRVFCFETFRRDTSLVVTFLGFTKHARIPIPVASSLPDRKDIVHLHIKVYCAKYTLAIPKWIYAVEIIWPKSLERGVKYGDVGALQKAVNSDKHQWQGVCLLIWISFKCNFRGVKEMTWSFWQEGKKLLASRTRRVALEYKDSADWLHQARDARSQRLQASVLNY